MNPSLQTRGRLRFYKVTNSIFFGNNLCRLFYSDAINWRRDVEYSIIFFFNFTVHLPAFFLTTYTSLRYSCTNCTAMEPSPTAEATRLTEAARTSPAAKTPA